MTPDVHLLGQVRIQDEAGLHRPPLDKRLGLLAHLACADHWVARDRLAFLFWPDVPDRRARTNLRSLLSRLRRLPGRDGVEVEPSRVRWRGGSDVRAFREAVAARAWSRAVQAYEGELLRGAEFAGVGELGAWLAAEREALRESYRRALLAWCEHVIPGDEARDAARRLEALLAEDPLDEDAALRAMGLREACGDRRRALRLGHDLRRHLAELEVEPREATERLLARLESGEAGAGSAVGAGSSAENVGDRHLPGSLTPFVARERERRELAERLAQDDCRLLTVTGLGGVGKTRLALRVAADMAQRYREGARFVALGTKRSLQDVAVAIAHALEAALPGDEEADRVLPEALRNRHALLVLDDLDPRVAPASLLAELLNRCTGIDLLVTARERLDLGEEWLYPVTGMAQPDPDGEAEAARGADALRLFVDAAQRVEPRFRLRESDLPAAARVCALVEGLPLGLELAAAWVRALPLSELADELEGNLDLLRRKPRGAGDRHQSVRAALEHSWARLEAGEAEAFMMLSVFHGGFRRDAAAEIAGVGVAQLAALVDRSLLRLSPEGRYDFHPLVGRYARAKLAERPDAERSARLRHRAHYVRWVGEAAQRFERQGSVGNARRMVEEYPNVREALDGALEEGDADSAAAIAQRLEWFWLWHGRLREGRALSARLMELVPAQGGVARARACLLQGEGAMMMQGDTERSAAAFREAHEIARDLDDRELAIEALNGLGFTAMHVGRHADARSCFERALDLAAGEEHAEVRTALLINLGALGVRSGDASRARAWLDAARALCVRVGNVKRSGLALLHLARLERQLGRADEARRLLAEAFQVVRSTEHTDLVARAHLHTALSARAEGDSAKARANLREALASWWEAGATGRVADVLRVAAALRADEGAPDEARELWERAERVQSASVSMLFPSEVRPLRAAVVGPGNAASRPEHPERESPSDAAAGAESGVGLLARSEPRAVVGAELAAIVASLGAWLQG